MRRFLILLCVLFLNGCVAGSPNPPAPSPDEPVSNQELVVDCDSSLTPYIEVALAEWLEAYPHLDVQITYSDQNPNFVCEPDLEFPTEAYARLTDGVIYLYPVAAEQDPIYLVFASMHEIGHWLFDYGHHEDPEAVMGTSFDWELEQLCITQTDVDWVCEVTGDCSGVPTC